MGCQNTIMINVSPEKVWATISNFHDMSWAPEVITSVDVIGTHSGYEVGAKRILNDVFHETLTEVDSDNFTFSYSIDDGPGPVSKEVVSNYIGMVKLTAKGNGTLVEWKPSFQIRLKNHHV
mgnify:CR=1 FL=1